MNKFINYSIIILIVLTICLITFSITYAWFVTSQSTNNINSATSGKLEIIYDKGQDVNGTLRPSSSKENGLSASVKIRKSDSSVDGLATIKLHVTTIDQALAVSGLKWELFKNTDSTSVASGTFYGINSNSDINLIENYLLTTTDTTFTLYIWLNGDEVDNSVMNKSFSAYITATARSNNVNLD